jgi:hypothetical protein
MTLLFHLDDVNDTPIKNAAITLGIPNAAGKSKAELIKEIREKVSTTGALVLTPVMPLAPPPPPAAKPGSVVTFWAWLASIAGLLSAMGALVTAGLTYMIAQANKDSAIASSQSAQVSRDLYHTELEKMRQTSEKEIADKEDELLATWRRVMVYKILQDSSKSDNEWNGLTLEEIRRRYAVEVASKKHPRLGSEELDELAIRRHLLALMEAQLVLATIEDRYVTQKSSVNSKEEIRRGFSNKQVAYAILQVLARDTDAGQHTVPELGQLVMEKIKNCTIEEYNAVINELVALKYVRIDEMKKVWSAANPRK